MKINVASLLEGQILPVEKSFDPKSLDPFFIDYQFTTSIQLNGTVEKIDKLVTFRGTLKSNLQQTCGRCVEISTKPVVKPFELFYEVSEQVEIDTLDDLREILIMDHPLIYVCSDQCKGLCPECGTNWNQNSCKCSLTNRPESLSSWQLTLKKKLEGKDHHGES